MGTGKMRLHESRRDCSSFPPYGLGIYPLGKLHRPLAAWRQGGLRVSWQGANEASPRTAEVVAGLVGDVAVV